MFIIAISYHHSLKNKWKSFFNGQKFNFIFSINLIYYSTSPTEFFLEEYIILLECLLLFKLSCFPTTICISYILWYIIFNTLCTIITYYIWTYKYIFLWFYFQRFKSSKWYKKTFFSIIIIFNTLLVKTI